ncbi:MAG TPA: 2Fe-2S iron-sulfur cluster-binding protein [Pseudonocardiaceae bacterium]|nr:2Fe-2S iron-sulfur cluster-binding protein [Pseudonocardiaceae bacterium]
MSGPRPVRAAADELVEVSCTVNGSPVTVSVPPRLTLADLLRDRLHLTGTHIGCEHGVCGMCTVLVDGHAARSCILFACQVDSADIVTVEGLGTPDRQHPLQEAFSRHHALQCGFCTPGFLISAYDLLRHRPDVPAAELPTELSGVLCRCTGYRNIVAAVAEVADTYSDGVPEPLNCRTRAPGGPTTAAPRDIDISLPDAPPTAAVEVASEIAAPVAAVWGVLSDVRLLASCLPGAELTADLGGDRYAGRAGVSLGPIRLSFDGVAHVLERDPAGRRMLVLAKGSDAGGGGTQARLTLTATPSETGTRLAAAADVYLTGRIAQFGRALAGDVSRRMFERFADAVEHAAVGDTRRGHRASGRSLILAVLGRRLRRWLHRR